MNVNVNELILKAERAMEHAYAPYSGFRVGAALLTKSGEVFTGCNVENASFGATNCAERTAIFKAVSEGYTDFLALAVVSSAGKLTPPCGICRQVISEFGADIDVILQGKQEGIQVFKASELLPLAFGMKE